MARFLTHFKVLFKSNRKVYESLLCMDLLMRCGHSKDTEEGKVNRDNDSLFELKGKGKSNYRLFWI